MFQILSKLSLKTASEFQSVNQAGERFGSLKTHLVIFGHIDSRHNGGEYGHRVCLGMGVDHGVRKQVGGKLIESVVPVCRDTQGIDWLDLNIFQMSQRKIYI
ncbi:hypothetical protein O9992_18560 [Vibrio lentus]|nr:hypothetical protein [Vibrio lentus]